MPKYSFIIPVYNAEKVIERIVHQILDQPYKDLEIILINDGSQDDSLNIITNLAKHDDRIVTINKPNGGPSSARNKGLKKARGQFIIFCDSDDEINGLELSKSLLKFEGTNQDMIVLGWKIVQKDNSGHITSSRELIMPEESINNQDEIILKTLKSIGEDGRMYNLWNKIYRADIIKNHKLALRNDLKFGEDLLFNFKFLDLCQKIYFTPGSGYYIYEEDSPTSIVGESKLDYFYRKENLRGLAEFTKTITKSNLYAKDLENFTKWRWLVSYALAVCNKEVSAHEQIEIISTAAKDQSLKPLNKSGYLKKSKYQMEKILQLLSHITPVFWLVMKLSLATKKRRRQKLSSKIILPEI